MSLLFTESMTEQCSPHGSFRWQIHRGMGFKSSKKLHTINNSCYSLGHLALTSCLKFSKVASVEKRPPLGTQLEITFQTGSAVGRHSKFLKAGLRISVGHFQKTAKRGHHHSSKCGYFSSFHNQPSKYKLFTRFSVH